MAQELVWVRRRNQKIKVGRAWAEKNGLKPIDEPIYREDGRLRRNPTSTAAPAAAKKAAESAESNPPSGNEE